MANNFWMKLYNEMLDDPKVGRLSDWGHRVMINCFLLASELDMDGVLPDAGDMAWRLRCEMEKLLEGLHELESVGIVVVTEDGGWMVRKFVVRQGRISDAEKQAAYRDRKRHALAAGYGFEDVTEGSQVGNEPVTGTVTDGNDVCYEAVTDGNADKIRKEIDTDKKRGDEDKEPAAFSAGVQGLVDRLYALLEMERGAKRPGGGLLEQLEEMAEKGVTVGDLQGAWDWYMGEHGVKPPRLAVLENPIYRVMAQRVKGMQGKKVRTDEFAEYVQH